MTLTNEEKIALIEHDHAELVRQLEYVANRRDGLLQAIESIHNELNTITTTMNQHAYRLSVYQQLIETLKAARQ